MICEPKQMHAWVSLMSSLIQFYNEKWKNNQSNFNSWVIFLYCIYVFCQIVPSLQKLAADFRKSSPAQETSALQLIGQLEATYGRTFILHLPTAGGPSDSSAPPAGGGHHTPLSLLTPSPSMDEMKSRVGKIFQKPAQSFWKK